MIWGRRSRGSNRVNRGGSWRNDNPDNFRGANRNRNDPGNRNDNQGFRLVSTAGKGTLSNPPRPVSRPGGNETMGPAAAGKPQGPQPRPARLFEGREPEYARWRNEE